MIWGTIVWLWRGGRRGGVMLMLRNGFELIGWVVLPGSGDVGEVSGRAGS